MTVRVMPRGWLNSAKACGDVGRRHPAVHLAMPQLIMAMPKAIT
jgi:hypothetical protein